MTEPFKPETAEAYRKAILQKAGYSEPYNPLKSAYADLVRRHYDDARKRNTIQPILDLGDSGLMERIKKDFPALHEKLQKEGKDIADMLNAIQ